MQPLRSDSTYSHRSSICIRIHWLTFLAECRQQLEVVDIVRWSVGVEELGFLVEGILECVRRASRHGHEFSLLGIDDVPIEATEAQGPLGDEEAFIVLGDIQLGFHTD
jgi:hypothetical protein